MRFALGTLMVAALLAGAGAVSAADKNVTALTGDAAVAKQVRHELLTYPKITIFDDVYFTVTNGTVHLGGAVSQPFKKNDIEGIAKHVAGVSGVDDQIKVLPLSNMDDQLRMRLARAIYGDPVMRKYAAEPMKSIHILVENGHVTLTGFVDSDFDKEIAGTRAASAGMSFGPIVNNLQVIPTAKS